jgi:hypothetical protein
LANLALVGMLVARQRSDGPRRAAVVAAEAA